MRAAIAAVMLLAACTAEAAKRPVAPAEAAATVATVATSTTLPTTTSGPVASTRRAAPDRLVASVTRALADRRFERTTVGASLWLDGYGDVLSHNPERLLVPASNQKILTAMACLAALGPDHVLTTEVVAAGSVVAGRLDGDLVLVGGGDPFLSSVDLASLARAVRDGGITHVSGRLVGDESRYDAVRTAPGWFDWHVPDFVSPLSALAVDGVTSADPSGHALAAFRAALAAVGIVVDGGSVSGVAPGDGTVVAGHASPPMVGVVARMMLTSNNLAAELLMKELGLKSSGAGSTAAGARAATDVASALGVPLAGRVADGSGLSRHNQRSAAELRALLVAAQSQPWWPSFYGALPVGGHSGTLAGRFAGTAAAGNVRAKSGWIIEGRALSGYVTTAGGARAVFSILVNGEVGSAAVQAAIDDVVVAMAEDGST